MNRLVIGSILLAFPAAAADPEGFCPAIRSNDLPRLRELSREKDAVRNADSKGMTPLLYATVVGSVAAMKVLIDAGADVNAAEALGAVPLHWAACEPVRVKLLLQHGAKANVASSLGRTPLIAAASCESGSESVDLLLKAGADIDASEKTGGTALMEALTSGGTVSARRLLAAGARARPAGELVANQREDAGWAQREHVASDAWMTALAMEALYESGQVRATDPVYRRGVDYLLRTQLEDGSWYVRSRAVKLQPYFQSGFPYDHDQWISMTATAQAAVALSRAERGVTRASAH